MTRLGPVLILLWVSTGWAQLNSPTTTTPPQAMSSTASAVNTLTQWFAGYEYVPTAAQYARLGVHLGPALVVIAENGQTALVVRARAISAMVDAHDQGTLDHLSRVLADVEAPSLLRRKAAYVLAARLGDAAIPPLVSAFSVSAEDVFLREACARGLRSIGPAAHSVRVELFAQETSPSVRALLRDAKQIRGSR